MSRYLCSPKIFGKERFIYVEGPAPCLPSDITPDGGPSLGHTNWLPDRYRNYLKLLPIRNPYDRVVSQWRWGLNLGEDYSFDEWLMIHSKQLIMFAVTKVYYPFDKIIRVEDIEDELRELGLLNGNHDFPHFNKSDVRNDFQLTQKQKDMIYYLHYSDFIEGGYEK